MIAARRQFEESGSLGAAMMEVRADYQAAKEKSYRKRREGIPAQGSGADWHFRNDADYLKVMEAARDMARNHSLIGPAINQTVSNAIQGGFTLEPRTGDSGLDAELFDRFAAWAKDPNLCDAAGEETFLGFEELALRQWLVDGDCWWLLTETGAMQAVEAHRIRTPWGIGKTRVRIAHGVELDALRRRLAVWICKDEIDPLRQAPKIDGFERFACRGEDGQRQVLQVYDPKRASQTRGVSAAAAICDPASFFDDLCLAASIKAQVANLVVMIRERDAGVVAPPPMGFGDRTTSTLADGSTRAHDKLVAGSVIEGAPGEKLKLDAARVPNPEFFQQLRQLAQLVGINFSLPLHVLMLDAGETNFSGWRGAVTEARRGFKRMQRVLVRRFHGPVYHWQLRGWLAEDEGLRRQFEKLGPRLFEHAWQPPAWTFDVQPRDDAEANAIKLSTGQISYRRFAAENYGCDGEVLWQEVCDDNAARILYAKKKAQEVNQQLDDGFPVHWREVLSMPLPEGMQFSQRSQAELDAQTKAAEKPAAAKQPAGAAA